VRVAERRSAARGSVNPSGVGGAVEREAAPAFGEEPLGAGVVGTLGEVALEVARGGYDVAEALGDDGAVAEDLEVLRGERAGEVEMAEGARPVAERGLGAGEVLQGVGAALQAVGAGRWRGPEGR
jgi:hypothetical protein